ncbi:MAG: hypothetical protein E7583_00350 [Ruminococcaceae bacterium]|nr:hypothetical protein [Oscillospiraceae bacterium]
MHYLLILGANTLLALCFVFQKKYQSIAGTSVKATLTFNAFAGLATLVIFTLLGLCGVYTMQFSPFSLVMATAATVICLSYMVIGFKLLRAGNMPLYTMFLMTGGMLIPYIFGLGFLDEEFSWLRLGGIILIVAAVVISNTGTANATKTQILMCVAVFLLNGLMSVTSKVHQADISTHFSPVNSESFILIMSIVKIVFCFPVAFILTKKANESMKSCVNKNTLLLFILTAASDSGSYYLQLIGAKSIDAGVLYPLVTAGSIIFSAVAGMIAFRERPPRNQWIAMTVCLAGTCMFIR